MGEEAKLTPENDPAQTAQKPGYKTTEFWLYAAAALLGILYASGVFDAIPGQADDQIAGLAATLLATFGYSVQRGLVKASGNKAAAIVAAARETKPVDPQ